MKKIGVFMSCLVASPSLAADILSLDDALRATYTACVGIDEELIDLKKMAGINTAITGVGVATGVGAVVVGIKKEQVDKEIDELITKLRAVEKKRYETGAPELSDGEKQKILDAMDTVVATAQDTELSQLQDKSKKLGNWRTGLLATGVATNVAGTIIAAKNKVDADLDTQINSCKESIANLRTSIMQARINVRGC